MSNTATILAHDYDIDISGGETFSGGIINSGKLLAGGRVGVPTKAPALPSLVRRGLPAGGGILIDGISAFAGGITNGGTISAAHTAVLLDGVSTFTGDILNTGAITATTGIAISGSTKSRRAAAAS